MLAVETTKNIHVQTSVYVDKQAKIFSVINQWQRLLYPMKRKIGRPRDSGPAQRT